MTIKLVCLSIFTICTGVLATTSFYNIDFLKLILGFNNVPSFSGFFQNMFINTTSMIAVLPFSNPEFSPTHLIFVRFFELGLILYGIFMLWKTRINRLNLAALIITVVLVVLSGLISNQYGASVFIVPAAIYITAGIRHLIHRWRQTFPKNPYARIAAYIPLGLLLISVTVLHYTIYFVLWPSQTSTHEIYTRDYQLLTKELNNVSDNTRVCFVQTENSAIKKLIIQEDTKCKPIFTFTDSEKVSKIITSDVNSPKILDLQKHAKVHALVSESNTNNVRWIVLLPPYIK